MIGFNVWELSVVSLLGMNIVNVICFRKCIDLWHTIINSIDYCILFGFEEGILFSSHNPQFQVKSQVLGCKDPRGLQVSIKCASSQISITKSPILRYYQVIIFDNLLEQEMGFHNDSSSCVPFR